MRHLTALLCALALPALADPPRIEAVSLHREGNGWRVDVTLSHPDTGWDHYADGWRVLDAVGGELGLRTLLHPHVDEQPFTRSLAGVASADGATTVFVEARCSVDGWSGERLPVKLP